MVPAALTVNTRLPFADLWWRGLLFDRKFAYRADASGYELQLRPAAICSGHSSRLRRRPAHGYTTDRTRASRVTDTRGAAAIERRCREPLVVAAAASFQPRTGTRRSTASCRGTTRHAVLRVTQRPATDQMGSPLAPTRPGFSVGYEPELERRTVFGEVGFDVTENFAITAGGRLVRIPTARSTSGRRRQPGHGARSPGSGRR